MSLIVGKTAWTINNDVIVWDDVDCEKKVINQFVRTKEIIINQRNNNESKI